MITKIESYFQYNLRDRLCNNYTNGDGICLNLVVLFKFEREIAADRILHCSSICSKYGDPIQDCIYSDYCHLHQTLK